MDKIKLIDFMIHTIESAADEYTKLDELNLLVETKEIKEQKQEITERLINYYKQWFNVFIIINLSDFKQPEIFDKKISADNVRSIYNMIKDIDKLIKK